jgi:hypothetical protein
LDQSEKIKKTTKNIKDKNAFRSQEKTEEEALQIEFRVLLPYGIANHS